MSRPRITIAIAIAALACCSLILCAVAADPRKPASKEAASSKPIESEPTPADELAPVEQVKDDPAEPVAGEDLGPWEVTDRLELVFRNPIAVAGDKTLSAKVLLKNKSETEIPGKLVLVVDGSSIEGTKLHAPQGQFTEATPYLQMLPAKRVLEEGQETPVKTLVLTTVESTQGMNLDTASLRWRAFTLTKPADLNDESMADDKQVPGKGYTWGEMRQAMAIQSNATTALLEKHGGAIVGTAISENANGELVILVYAAQGGMSRKLPGSIEGLPVQLTVTGTIKGGPAYSQVTMNDGKAEVVPVPEATPESAIPTEEPSSQKTTNATPQAAQPGPPRQRFIRPVPIGVSIINQTDVCASGTLGCRVFNLVGQQFVLSNNHVIAKENLGTIGNPVCQPSTGDLAAPNQCKKLAADVIGTLYDFQKIQFVKTFKLAATGPINTIDAAVALCPPGMVDNITPTEGYGSAARTPQEALYVGMPVQKYGRTTAYTKGKIYALNAETIINYGAPGYARFKYSINVRTQFLNPAFGAPGDSGSLVVTQADRRPVGLLYAGGGYDTYLNPISPVLTRFKAGVDDGAGGTPVLGSGRTGTSIGPVK
jgi:hypothetical protein